MRTIAHRSDIHVGKTDPAVVEGIVADVNAEPPSLVVMSGDFTQRARGSQYQEETAFLRRLPQPQLVVPPGQWQMARSQGDFTLVGCTVAPGFEFEHFELAPEEFQP